MITSNTEELTEPADLCLILQTAPVRGKLKMSVYCPELETTFFLA